MFGWRDATRDNPVLDAEEYAAHIEDKRDEIGECACCGNEIFGDAMEYGQYGDQYYQIDEKMIHKSCLENWLDEQPAKVNLFGFWVPLEDVDDSVNWNWVCKQPRKISIGGYWIDKEKAEAEMNKYYLQG